MTASKSVSQVGEQVDLFPEAANVSVPAKVVVAAPAAFDYLAAGLSEIEIVNAKDTVRRIRAHQCTAGIEIHDIGTLLISAKASFPHGRFTAWLKLELGMNQSTANRFMSVARMDRKIVSVTILPATTLYELAAPSTPETIRTAILDAAEAGEEISVKAVREKISKSKGRAAPRTARAAQYIEDSAPGDAVEFLRTHLGDRFQEFRAMVRDRNPQEFWKLLQG